MVLFGNTNILLVAYESFMCAFTFCKLDELLNWVTTLNVYRIISRHPDKLKKG